MGSLTQDQKDVLWRNAVLVVEGQVIPAELRLKPFSLPQVDL